MVSPSIVFHHPLPVDHEPKVGSTTHVTRMLHGFQASGYEVEVVAGHSKDRVMAMKRVRSDMAKGRQFAFAYAEASTAPTCLNDPDHLPRHPIADWRFLRDLHRRDVPVGLFYPDVYWRFPLYADAVPFVKRKVASAFYRFDLAWYRRVLDVMFLPSGRMRLSVPGWVDPDRVVSLAPGGEIDPLPVADRTGEIHLFYVGSVSPPLYDIRDLVRAVQNVTVSRLTISCPRNEAAVAEQWRSDRIEIVHEHGPALRKRYQSCDIACLFYAPYSYREFAMPVKLFEAIGYGRPLLANPGTTAASFIANADLGWITEPVELPNLLKRLAADRQLIDRTRASVVHHQADHSWESRARFVAETLLATSGNRPPSPTEPSR